MIASPAKTGMRSPPELLKWLIRPVALVDIKGMAKAAPAVPAGYLHPVLARRPTVSVLLSTPVAVELGQSLSDDGFAAPDCCSVGLGCGLVQEGFVELIAPVLNGVERGCPGVGRGGIGWQAESGCW
ncbi:MAG: hypothetical protein QOG46_1064 [Pseudonocardiales bacterium]|nr:hypothetical protein [Pseudonocardiales bacterium]